MKKNLLTFILTFTFYLVSGQLTVTEAMRLKDSVFGKYSGSDLEPNNVTLNLHEGYFRSGFAIKDQDGNVVEETAIKLAKLFCNKDGSYLLGLTYYYNDMQCFSYNSTFYPISKDGTKISYQDTTQALFPPMIWEYELPGEKAKKVLEKYLPEIQQNYLGPEATINDVLREVYTPHLIFAQKGNGVRIELTLCDYIPVNVVGIDSADWSVVQTDLSYVDFVYNAKSKQFNRVK